MVFTHRLWQGVIIKGVMPCVHVEQNVIFIRPFTQCGSARYEDINSMILFLYVYPFSKYLSLPSNGSSCSMILLTNLTLYCFIVASKHAELST